MEGVGLAVVGDVPALRHAGRRLGGRRQHEETLAQVVEDVGFRHAGQLMGIQGFRLGAVAAMEHRFGRGRSGEAGDAGEAEKGRRPQRGHQF